MCIRDSNIGGASATSGENMSLHMIGPDTVNVYNSVGLYAGAVSGILDVETPSGLVLFLDCPDPIALSGDMTLYTSGTAIDLEQLNLRIRGK